jgi:glycerophosphoryl diester phosphodiesterase
LDVRLSADGYPLVFHDRDLERLSGRNGKIGHLTATKASEVRLLGTNEKIPLLEEVLESVAGRVPLLVEIKCGSLNIKPLADAVVSTLSNYRGEVVIQSFNPFVLHYFRCHVPTLCRGQLSGGCIGLPFLRITQPDFVAYDVNYLPRPSVTRIRRHGIPVLAWTIRTYRQYERARPFADNFIFDATQDLHDCLPDIVPLVPSSL